MAIAGLLRLWWRKQLWRKQLQTNGLSLQPHFPSHLYEAVSKSRLLSNRLATVTLIRPTAPQLLNSPLNGIKSTIAAALYSGAARAALIFILQHVITPTIKQLLQYHGKWPASSKSVKALSMHFTAVSNDASSMEWLLSLKDKDLLQAQTLDSRLKTLYQTIGTIANMKFSLKISGQLERKLASLPNKLEVDDTESHNLLNISYACINELACILDDEAAQKELHTLFFKEFGSYCTAEGPMMDAKIEDGRYGPQYRSSTILDTDTFHYLLYSKLLEILQLRHKKAKIFGYENYVDYVMANSNTRNFGGHPDVNKLKWLLEEQYRLVYPSLSNLAFHSLQIEQLPSFYKQQQCIDVPPHPLIYQLQDSYDPMATNRRNQWTASTKDVDVFIQPKLSNPWSQCVGPHLASPYLPAMKTLQRIVNLVCTMCGVRASMAHQDLLTKENLIPSMFEVWSWEIVEEYSERWCGYLHVNCFYGGMPNTAFTTCLNDNPRSIFVNLSLLKHTVSMEQNQRQCLSASQLQCIFHELGHAMFLLLTTKSTLEVSALPLDDLEVPAALMEYIALSPLTLKSIAFHQDTNTPLPDMEANEWRLSLHDTLIQWLPHYAIDLMLHSRMDPSAVSVDELHDACVEEYFKFSPTKRTTYFNPLLLRVIPSIVQLNQNALYYQYFISHIKALCWIDIIKQQHKQSCHQPIPSFNELNFNTPYVLQPFVEGFIKK